MQSIANYQYTSTSTITRAPLHCRIEWEPVEILLWMLIESETYLWHLSSSEAISALALHTQTLSDDSLLCTLSIPLSHSMSNKTNTILWHSIVQIYCKNHRKYRESVVILESVSLPVTNVMLRPNQNSERTRVPLEPFTWWPQDELKLAVLAGWYQHPSLGTIRWDSISSTSFS